MPSALAARLAVETQQRQQHARLPTAQPPYPSASASAAFSANSWSDVLAGLESTNERLSAATAAGRDFPPPQSAEFGRPWVPDVQVAASGGAESGARVESWPEREGFRESHPEWCRSHKTLDELLELEHFHRGRGGLDADHRDE